MTQDVAKWPKIAGKWMFIPLKMVLIGIDPYPCIHKITSLVDLETWETWEPRRHRGPSAGHALLLAPSNERTGWTLAKQNRWYFCSRIGHHDRSIVSMWVCGWQRLSTDLDSFVFHHLSSFCPRLLPMMFLITSRATATTPAKRRYHRDRDDLSTW